MIISLPEHSVSYTIIMFYSKYLFSLFFSFCVTACLQSLLVFMFALQQWLHGRSIDRVNSWPWVYNVFWKGHLQSPPSFDHLGGNSVQADKQQVFCSHYWLCCWEVVVSDVHCGCLHWSFDVSHDPIRELIGGRHCCICWPGTTLNEGGRHRWAYLHCAVLNLVLGV